MWLSASGPEWKINFINYDIFSLGCQKYVKIIHKELGSPRRGAAAVSDRRPSECGSSQTGRVEGIGSAMGRRCNSPNWLLQFIEIDHSIKRLSLFVLSEMIHTGRGLVVQPYDRVPRRQPD